MTTVIRNGHLIAFKDGRHVCIPAGVVAFDGNCITSVGDSFSGEAIETIDATGKIICPGFVNAHLHVTDTPFTRGYWEDMGRQGAAPNYEGLYRILPTVRGAVSIEDELIAAECAFAELLLAGSTTVVELGFDFEMMEGGAISTTERMVEIAARMGVRAYFGPRYRSGYWSLGAGNKVQYHWYADRGRKRFDDCIAFCQSADRSHDDMIRTMLAPGQIDTCDADMLRETRRVADRIKVPVQLHAGQSPTEYRTIKQAHGCSTIDFLADTGLLGNDFIIGHGMYLTEDGEVDRFPAAELAALVESRTTIVHLPWVKARQGAAMRSFGKFVRAGVRMGLGTDTYPFDIIQEMRCAATLSRAMDNSPVMTTSAQIFHAATVGGAEALGRSDLGRLETGAKADIILIDARKPHAVPMRDPIGFLVFSATGADVDTVIVNGHTVVRNRVVQTTDLDAALGRLAEAAARVSARIGDRL
jgi:5-methylthioadenosine/S-adenosylhomocysteine deaminase